MIVIKQQESLSFGTECLLYKYYFELICVLNLTKLKCKSAKLV